MCNSKKTGNDRNFRTFYIDILFNNKYTNKFDITYKYQYDIMFIYIYNLFKNIRTGTKIS